MKNPHLLTPKRSILRELFLTSGGQSILFIALILYVGLWIAIASFLSLFGNYANDWRFILTTTAWLFVIFNSIKPLELIVAPKPGHFMALDNPFSLSLFRYGPKSKRNYYWIDPETGELQKPIHFTRPNGRRVITSLAFKNPFETIVQTPDGIKEVMIAQDIEVSVPITCLTKDKKNIHFKWSIIFHPNHELGANYMQYSRKATEAMITERVSLALRQFSLTVNLEDALKADAENNLDHIRTCAEKILFDIFDGKRIHPLEAEYGIYIGQIMVTQALPDQAILDAALGEYVLEKGHRKFKEQAGDPSYTDVNRTLHLMQVMTLVAPKESKSMINESLLLLGRLGENNQKPTNESDHGNHGNRRKKKKGGK